MANSPQFGDRAEMHMPPPASPYGMDSMREMRDSRTMGGSFEPQRQMSDPGFFQARPAGTPLPSFMPSTHESSMMIPMEPDDYQHTEELVRRTNLLVQFVNFHISPLARYSQLQPKMCDNGKFPRELSTARTIEEVRAMDPSSLDRILRAYGLPTDLRSLRFTSP